MEAFSARALQGRPRYPAGPTRVATWLVPLVVASAAAWLLTADWIAAAALWVLWAGWHYLRPPEDPPVLALAFTFQWIQVDRRRHKARYRTLPLPSGTAFSSLFVPQGQRSRFGRNSL